MSWENRKWVIVNYSNVTDEMIDNCNERNRNVLRHTIQGIDKVILKWDGNTPSCFEGMTTYSHSEILEELASPDWSEDEE
tara:strand:- start:1435 stop:1674 length:240 start_codon:yes stop_codon:yes gene_type:complete